MAFERVWRWVNSAELSPLRWLCPACQEIREHFYMTPSGMMCGGCHQKIADRVMVKLAWDNSTNSASFTWAGLGGGKIFMSAADEWVVEGGPKSAADQKWTLALTRWAQSMGYLGPDPFSRNDWAVFHLEAPEAVPDPG